MRSLFRAILREHRASLPDELRRIGNAYVRKEFRDHRGATATQVAEFERSWTRYLTDLRSQAALATGRDDPNPAFGKDLDAAAVEAMTDEQRVKLVDVRLSLSQGGEPTPDEPTAVETPSRPPRTSTRR